MPPLGTDSSSVAFGLGGEGLPNNLSNKDFFCRVGTLAVTVLLSPSMPDVESTPCGNVMLAVVFVSGEIKSGS